MRLLGSGYRDLPKFVLRRIDHAAGEINGVLLVAAIALAILDLLCLAVRIADTWPAMVAAGGP
jgi:hypothetical protein